MTVSKINASRSRLTIKAFAGGILSSFGHNPSFTARKLNGEISFSEDAPEQSRLHILIDANSLELIDDVSTKDRDEIMRTMKDQVLETSQYPEITFESTEVSATKVYEGFYRATITGTLSLHGESTQEKVEANVTVSGGNLRANGDFSIRQTDFGIRLVSVAGGSLKVKDELKITFEIVAQP